jgi:hypothetical protein
MDIEQCKPCCDKDEFVMQQAQQLLLLRHSRKCIYKDEGSCPKSPHCWIMQKVWNHLMTKCTVNECSVPHCTISLMAMKHFVNCQDISCSICEPVRATVGKRSREREKDLYRAADGLRLLCTLSEQMDESSAIVKKLPNG